MGEDEAVIDDLRPNKRGVAVGGDDPTVVFDLAAGARAAEAVLVLVV